MTTFLLVHGSWHGPWCWDLLQPELTARGARSATVDLPSCGTDPASLGTLADDARVVGDAAASLDDDVVVVAHSYGGVPTTEATYARNVRRLIYLAAFMPDTGRNYVSYLPPGPLPPYVGLREDGSFEVPQGQSKTAFYADCTDEVAGWAEAQLRLQSQAVMAPGITAAAWHDLPTTYIVTTQDQALPPDFQGMFAQQADKVYHFEASHSPMLSRPADLADLLISATT